jgi:predicted SAM-dependent methyltransferase
MVKLNLGCGKFPLKGFTNLDIRGDLAGKPEFQDCDFTGGWKWQEGLPNYEDNSVDAITESHSLMYCTVEEYPAVLAELKRVLVPGGVLRITEDNCEQSEELLEQFGLPWGNPDSKTGAKMMRRELERVGFEVHDMIKPKHTLFGDSSLIQQFHGTPPRVFHMEAIKPIERPNNLWGYGSCTPNEIERIFGLNWWPNAIKYADWEYLMQLIEQYQISTVLEFGSGLSTLLMRENPDLSVVSYESDERWLKLMQEKAPDADIRSWDKKEIKEDLGFFDLALVDGPGGGGNREFSTKIASEHSDIVVIHDEGRDAERLWQEKYLKGVFERSEQKGAMCRTWFRR